MIKSKSNGQVFTPESMVKYMLDEIFYNNKSILKKHIIDNSCGDGAFLVEIVDRYCMIAKNVGMPNDEIKKDLETYIHGIEIDDVAYKRCLLRLQLVASNYGIYDVNFDIINGDAILINEYNNFMDYVVGNPPYVKIHNIDKSKLKAIKDMKFSKLGMTDLYVVFYEIGLNMLNENGVLCYINPSSIFTNTAGKEFRKHIIDSKYLEKVQNLKHTQIFDDITTYCCIIKLFKKHNSNIIRYLDDVLDVELNYEDFNINVNFYFGNVDDLKVLKDILTYSGENKVRVKNGYATLNNKIFIKDAKDVDTPYKISVIKSSTNVFEDAIFPYDNDLNLIPFDNLDFNLREYLNKNKSELLKRDKITNDNWYAFGRTQALSDTFVEKISVNTIIKSIKDVKLNRLDVGQGVYSGLYIVGETFTNVVNILKTQDFINFIKLLGKYKSGGFYTFSSKDLESYMNYKLSKNVTTVNDAFLDVINSGFSKYLEFGPRSNEKVKVLHEFIKNTIFEKLSKIFGDDTLDNIKLHSLDSNPTLSKEYLVEGNFYNKKIDIVVEYKDKIVACVGLRFTMSNFKQNAVNYFDSMVGETLNVQSKSIPYYQIFILPDVIPYFNNSKKMMYEEVVGKSDLNKYLNLYKNQHSLCTPSAMLICSIYNRHTDYTVIPEDKYNEKYIEYSNNCRPYLSGYDGLVYNDFNKFIDIIINNLRSVIK